MTLFASTHRLWMTHTMARRVSSPICRSRLAGSNASGAGGVAGPVVDHESVRRVSGAAGGCVRWRFARCGSAVFAFRVAPTIVSLVTSCLVVAGSVLRALFRCGLGVCLGIAQEVVGVAVARRVRSGAVSVVRGVTPIVTKPGLALGPSARASGGRGEASMCRVRCSTGGAPTEKPPEVARWFMLCCS